jgi:tetratricopeptide (TPR) repeat protein
MPDPIDSLVQDWKANPNAAKTIALCNALRGKPHGPLMQQVGDFATQRLGDDAAVLLSVARMYMDVQRYADAQQVLVAAGKVAPRDAFVYRLLGEALLRRGDASRAEKVLARAIQLGARDEDTQLWLEHARIYKPLQSTDGAKAVAAELAKQNAPPVRELLDSMSETTTGVIDRPKKKASPHADGTTPVLLPSPTNPQYDPNDETMPHLEAARLQERFDRAADAPDAAPADTEILDRSPFDSDNGETEIVDAPAMVPSPPMRPLPTGPSVPKARAPLSGAAGRASAISPRPPRVSLAALPGSTLAVPHPRDVLDALELSGLYEPQVGGASGWDAAAKGPKRKGGPLLIGIMVLFVGASVGTYFLYRDRRAKDHIAAVAVLATVESQLSAGKVESLPDIEKEMTSALQLESRSTRAALDWARDRALSGLVKGGEDVGFEDSMTRAKDLGVAEDQYAFARVASFLYQGDTAGAAGVMAKWDGPAGGDAWYQLMAGATLDRAGDARARDRYAAAVKIAPSLFPAQVALARATAIEGDPVEAARLAKGVRALAPDRAEGVALVALAWSRDPRREETPAPPEVDDVGKRGDELPLGLKSVPHAIAALRAIDKHAGEDARAELQKGLAVADSPGVAVWIGSIALGLGDEALPRKAALAALQMSAAYAPARSLAARIALLGGRLDEALKATEDLDASSPDAAVVRAAVAYERVDADGIARALEALPPEARKLPVLGSLALGPDQLSGKTHLDPVKVLALAASDAPWSDLVAMDAALDDGDLATADKIAVPWGKDAESQALRALRLARLARLARYENRLDAADALSQVAMERGTVTPRVLWERVYTLVARGRAADVGVLIGRYPLVLGPVATWLSAFASASGGAVDAAKGRVASLDPPPSGAPLGVRVVAAAAFGAMKDKHRGSEYVKDVLSTGSTNPDLVAAALALGFRKVDHGKKRPTYE